MNKQGHDHFYKVRGPRPSLRARVSLARACTHLVMCTSTPLAKPHCGSVDALEQVLRVMAQWDILDEADGRRFSANAATRQLVRGKEATLGSFVDHQVPLSPSLPGHTRPRSDGTRTVSLSYGTRLRCSLCKRGRGGSLLKLKRFLQLRVGVAQINEPKWDAWKVLPEAVRTGQVAFALAHDGLDMHEVCCMPRFHHK